MKTFPSFLCAVLLSAACTNPDSSSNQTKASSSLNMATVKQSIEASNKTFTEAALRGDSAGIVNLYHSNAKVYPPNMPAGDKSSMSALAVALPKMGVKSFTLHTTDVEGNADLVVETGTYEMGDGTKTIDKGKYMVAWKPEDGNWKLWRDIWNSDNPPMPMVQK